jgi:hypothetical protein
VRSNCGRKGTGGIQDKEVEKWRVVEKYYAVNIVTRGCWHLPVLLAHAHQHTHTHTHTHTYIYNIFKTWNYILYIIILIYIYYIYCYIIIYFTPYALFCIFCFHRANWHFSATLTEVFPWFFLSCKGITRKDGARPALFPVS